MYLRSVGKGLVKREALGINTREECMNNLTLGGFKLLALVMLVMSITVLAGFGDGEKLQPGKRSADAEGVSECMQSCEDMVEGWLEMNPNSNNYLKQKEKIARKALQCLRMNEWAGFPETVEDILTSCGQQNNCVEIPQGTSINDGTCAPTDLISKLDLSPCCTEEQPDQKCGVNENWVVGTGAIPSCYIE